MAPVRGYTKNSKGNWISNETLNDIEAEKTMIEVKEALQQIVILKRDNYYTAQKELEDFLNDNETQLVEIGHMNKVGEHVRDNTVDKR